MQSSESEVPKCFTFFTLSSGAKSSSSSLQPAQRARWSRALPQFYPLPSLPEPTPVTDPVRQLGHPTAGTGNGVTCRMAGHRPPWFLRVIQTGADIRRKGKNRIQINLAQSIYILASGARFAQDPLVKNLWGNAGPSSPFPCTFCWEMNVLYSVTFSTILLYF